MLYLCRLDTLMKKLLLALCLLSIPALAQLGIVRSISGIHAPSAKTLPQGSLFISGSFEMVSDGHALSIEEGYTNKNGEFVQLDQNTPSNTENLFVSFALKEILKMLPYVVTIIVLIISSLRNQRDKQPPQSLGLPYFREDR